MGLWVTGGCAALTHPTKPTSTLSLCPLVGALRLPTLQKPLSTLSLCSLVGALRLPTLQHTHRVIVIL